MTLASAEEIVRINDAIREGRVRTAGGNPVDQPVEGALIVLDAVGCEVADAWEEARYERVDCSVNTMDGVVEAIVYVCAEDDEAMPVDDRRLTLLSDPHVEAAIASFESTMRAIRTRERPS